MTSPSLSVEELKKRACETIEQSKNEIVDIAQQILANPEAGFGRPSLLNWSPENSRRWEANMRPV